LLLLSILLLLLLVLLLFWLWWMADVMCDHFLQAQTHRCTDALVYKVIFEVTYRVAPLQ
jgi:hypothetical protein